MKKLLGVSVALLMLVSSCGNKKHKKHTGIKKEERIEIVPFYKNVAYVKDLHLIDTNQFLVEPEEFLTEAQFDVFTRSMWMLIRDPKAKVYPDFPFSKPYNREELKERFVYCDSMAQVDENDQQIGKAFWACDSITIMNNLARITFYESWYLNTKTNLIEKETLGYSMWSYVKEKEAFREMFVVFRDETAAKKCELYEFSP